ncbi:chromatin accessibility complex protein 1 [Anopheles cruzii]|uniref:chromatin accessibility complex protein 1 n=1 Tax=Anopheles cruzii TaxID=68878 RepID=UPI0022EC4CDE|nr:chromatin accessibility complex protein 1 [Anopheles cruzii]
MKCLIIRYFSYQTMDQERLTQLPMSRIKTVMKTSPDMGNINQEALFLMCRAAEMFIEHLAHRAHNPERKTLDYSDLAKYVEKEDALEFLQIVLPQKITVREYKELMAQKAAEAEMGSEEDDSDEGSEVPSEAPSGAGEEDNGADEVIELDDDDLVEVQQKSNPEIDSLDSASSSGDSGSVISIDSSSDEKENSKNDSNKKSPVKHKTGDSP